MCIESKIYLCIFLIQMRSISAATRLANLFMEELTLIINKRFRVDKHTIHCAYKAYKNFLKIHNLLSLRVMITELKY